MYRVRAIKYGSQFFPGPWVFYIKYWGEWIYLEFYFWLVQNEKHNILVDVGMDRARAERYNPHIINLLKDKRAEIKVDIDPPEALRQIGIQPQDIDYVILSHSHIDHIGCVPCFPKATIIMSRYGLEWIMNPPYPNLVDPEVNPKDIVEFLFIESCKPNGRVLLTDDEASPLPGIRTIRTGGHSMDSQIIFIETNKGMVGLGVDNLITFENLESNIAPGSPLNLLDSLRAMELLKQEADFIIPGHDPGLYNRFPNGIIV